LQQKYIIGTMRNVIFWLGWSLRAFTSEAAAVVSTLNDLVTARFSHRRFRERRRALHDARRKQMRVLVTELASHRSGMNRDRSGPRE
jgi:hypothetical protein